MRDSHAYEGWESLATILLAVTALGFLACGSRDAIETAAQPGRESFLEGAWDPFNRATLEGLIREHGRGGARWDADHAPVAVFDWDNTSIAGDVQETVFLHQLENLQFDFTPEMLGKVIREGIPSDRFTRPFSNQDGGEVSIEEVATDIERSYRVLYHGHEGLNGDEPLERISGMPEYREFVAKMLFAYRAIGATFDHRISYPWVIYMLAGMTDREVTALSNRAIGAALEMEMGRRTWTSPKIDSAAGVVSVEVERGIRLSAEMQSLYRVMTHEGFDVYVCSASFSTVVRAIASGERYGYGLDPANVVAMEVEREADGRLLPRYRRGYPQTQGPGKVEALRAFLPRPPVFVAGDSDGDVDMLTAFEETELRLVIDRGGDGPIARLVERGRLQRGRSDASWLIVRRLSLSE